MPRRHLAMPRRHLAATLPCLAALAANVKLLLDFAWMDKQGESEFGCVLWMLQISGCGKSFIWVVRPPIGFDINSEFREDEWLPEGFVERVQESGKGLVVCDWAPQLEILWHSTVSVFLSHYRWNSVLESLSQAVPILGWPTAAE
ncbi:UDP-glycosyltransferase protein [Vigna angularis]|uniref:UDP-glycosyltransferase protein n=1 Tax=Phaseolus angularis TaxID=3914 RepID=A0A8T0JS91_PHAAN|nr:UDP-glycosyltransferase protein [Vigna angularis]